MTAENKSCIVIKDLTPTESGSYFEKFGEEYWNDTENIVCIPVNKLNSHRISKFEMFFGISLTQMDYLIIHLPQ